MNEKQQMKHTRFTYEGQTADESRGEARPLADLVQRMRLAQLAHSENDLAATVATLGLLLLRRLDQAAT